MIIKQVVVSVLNKVLGKYVKDLDTSNLELAILSGQAVLKSLELKEDALREFDLPVEVNYGYVGEIFLSIPWTNLYASPCYISIEDVYLIAGPVKDKPYDAEKTKATEVSIKRKRLRQIEESTKAKDITTAAEITSVDGSDSSFMEKLVAQVVKNLKVTVQNIHFRYEDKVTSEDSPFAFGFTLNNLSAETTDQDWQTCIVDAAETTIYKLASLDNLAVYWNTNLPQSSLFSGKSDWKMRMKDGISRKGNIQGAYEFILHPLSAECHVILDQSSVIELDTPKLLVEVIQQELALALSQKQFHNLMDLLDSFELMIINQKYKKYQPTQTVHGHSEKWWRYAYTAICEEKIRCWSWDRIKQHRTKYKAYKELYKKKLKGFHESEMERSLDHLQILEDDLDIPSILIARQQGEIEVPPHQRKAKEVNQPSQSGWWSWMGLGAGASTAVIPGTENVEENLLALTMAALPAEEKEKLYQAINYSESTAPIKYPVEYVKRRLTFNLDSCKVVLLDNKKSKIAEISTKGFAAALEQRPGGDAVMFSCEVNSFQVHGRRDESNSDRPCLVSSKTSSSGMGSALLWFSFELNPLAVQADYSVKLKIEPVEVNYDNLTIENIVDFFDVPNKSKLYELEAAAANKLQELQSWTRAGLEYAISQHKITYVDMDISSPYIVIPEYGNLKREGSVLVIDLGHLRVLSDLVSRTKTIAQATDDEIAKMFYDQFNVMITDVQVILADKDSDWKVLHKQDATSDHILPSIGLELQAFKSISAEYPELPEFKVNGVIPKIWLKLSDHKYKQLMRFIKNFPFGKETKTERKPRSESKSLVDKEWTHNLSTLSLEEAQGIQNICREAFQTTEDEEGEVWFDSVEYLPRPRTESKTSKSPERTQLVGEFAIQQLLVTIDKADSTLDKPYISLEIKSLSTTLIVNTWNISATTTLGFIELLDNHFHGPDGSSLCVLSSKSKTEWISINYVKADPKGPEFPDKFNNTEQRIKIVFSSIELTAQQEALASFEMFVFALLESEESEPILPVVRKTPIPLETIAEDEVFNARHISPVSRSVIDLCIEAEMEEVSVTLIAKEKKVGQIKVSGLDVKVNVRGPETKINTMLKDLSILNATEGTIYPKILCLQGNTVFDCEITLFDNKGKSNDPLALDVIVDLKLGRFTFVFLSGFTAHIQDFLQALVSPETVSYAQNLTQKAIKSKAQGIQESGSKIELNISVHAPQLIIPGHSFSKDMMIADLGRLEITNAISKDQDGILMDNMAVTLKSFEVRCLSENVKNATDYLIEPIKLDITVRRRLQATKSYLPLIEVDAVLPLLKINIAIPDYELLMMVLTRNLSEGKEELDTPPRASSEDSLNVAEDRVEEFRHRIASVFEPVVSTEASTSDEDEQINLKCNFNVQKVVVLSPVIVDNQIKPYLVLNIEKLLTTVTLDKWTVNVQADLGTIDLIDRMNTGPDDQPVSIISSSKEEDLISVGYKMVDPACPEFESTHCSVQQTANVEFRKLKINCPQKSAIDLQAHILALSASLPQSTEAPTDASSSSSTSSSESISFKLGATLWEVEVVLGTDKRDFANVCVKGLAADILLSDGGVFLKSTQRDLSITDLNPNTYYPKIISVENENVFDFVFKYYGTSDVVYSSSCTDSESSSELKADGSLDMNIGRVNVVFVYRFVDELMRYFEPLTSPQSTKYVQEAASKTVYTQFESLQSQGTRIALDVKINAPLIVMPRHSSSIDMLIADLGHLELQNEFEVFEVPESREKIVFDMMELTLQSVQLARGRMDLSNSSVVKRYLIEPIKMDANIRRSLKPSCHDFPFIEANASLDFVKMNLGMKDYQLLTTITQENLNEGNNLHSAVDANVAQEQVINENVAEVVSAENESADTSSLATSSSEEPWEYMAFAFEVPGVTLTLYANEKDLDPFDSQSPIYDPETALCRCDVDKTALQIAIPSDYSVLVQGILHGITVEDIRQNSCSEFPRLIDKKLGSYSKVLTSSQDMCEFIYSQKVNGDMDVVLQLQNAAIYVSFPFIWPLIEFFTTVPKMEAEGDHFMTPAESQTSLDAPPPQSSSLDARPPQSSSSPVGPSQASSSSSNERSPQNVLNRMPVSKPSQVTANYKMTVRGTVKKPDIVLLANPLVKDSEALILQTEVEFEYTMANENQSLHSVISGLQMMSCQFPNIKDTSFMVLSPCDVNLDYKTPWAEGKGQGITVECENMKFQCSPSLYHIINDVVVNLSGQEKVTEGVQTDGEQRIKPPDDLWEPHHTTADRWRRKTAQSTEKNTVSRQSTGDKITLNTKEVQVVLDNEVHGALVPLLLMKTQVQANALDYTAQMKLEADISVEVTYYNERLGAWEPLIELVDEDRDNPRWELQLKIFFADGYISSFTPRDQESIDGPPQDMTDGPDAHRWIAWQDRPRSESKKALTAKPSVLGQRFKKSFKSSKRDQRRMALKNKDSDEEEDLDYEGALQHFVLSSTRLVGPELVDPNLDQVDGDVTDDGFLSDEVKPQATYIVLNSHDAIQLTVTPTSLGVLTDLSTALTEKPERRVRSILGPTFSIQNELGIHATVVVGHDEKIFDKKDEILTVCHRKPKLERNVSLSDAFATMALTLLAENRKSKKKSLFSEPLLDRFREKFSKIQKKRSASLPLALEGKSSRSKPAKFHIGDEVSGKKRKLVKSASCDTGSDSSGMSKCDTSDSDDDEKVTWKTRMRKRKNELFSLIKHVEEDETDSAVDDGKTTTLSDMVNEEDAEEEVGQNVAYAVGNVGALIGGISSPTFSDDDQEHSSSRQEAEGSMGDSVDGRREQEEESYLAFEVDGFYMVDYVPISRSGRYLYKLKPRVGNETNLNSHAVVQVDIKNGQKTVILRSPIQLFNHLDMPVDLMLFDDMKIGKKQPFKYVQTVDPGTSSNIPLSIAHDKDLYIKPRYPRCDVCPDSISWRLFSKNECDFVLKFPQEPLVRSLESLESLESLDTEEPLQVKVRWQEDLLNKKPSNDVPHHVIHLHPPITLHNLLPVEIARLSKDNEEREELILPGEKVPVMTDSVEHSCQLTIKLKNYKEEDWIGILSVTKETGKTTELVVTSLQDSKNQMTLGVLIMPGGTTDITLYSPYWLINKTSLPMEYRVSKTHQIYNQSAIDDQPVLFNFTGKSSRRVRLKVSDCPWSKRFSLDAVGDCGVVSCQNSKKTRKFEFVVQIEMSQTSLTKIITLTPKYVVINKTEFSISYCEDGSKSPLWFAIEPDEIKPFWPRSSLKHLLIKPTLSSFVSKPIPFEYSHTTVLRMFEPRAINVEVHGEVKDSVTTILFTPYSPGEGTIRIENLCDDVALRFMQEEVGHVTILQPQFSILYTWDDPTKTRRLLWKPYLGVDDAMEAPVSKDDYGQVQLEINENGPDLKEERKAMEDTSNRCVPSCLNSSMPSQESDDDAGGADEVDSVAARFRRNKRSKKTIFWVSLLDGLQRVLVFTQNGKLAAAARRSSECEPVTFELFVSLDGVGMSLMNRKPEEVANITLSSSTSVWQVEKSPGRWKTLGIELASWLEDAWKHGKEQIKMDEKADVDFSRMFMKSPHEGALRRSFEPAFWFHYCSSQHYQSVHCKMHRIQIDNQLYGTVFPVVLYPAPLPPGVATRHGPKPFIEMSVIYHEVPGQGIYHFKYAKALVQEMNVKLDKSFIIAIGSLLSKPPEEYNEEEYFKTDMNRVKVHLKETIAVKTALQTQRVFLEYFHLSPLKINLSFSLVTDVDEDLDQVFAENIMDFFVDSIGATLTDMNDAQLKLAFFERVGVFITQENLQAQITTHYTMQGVRQVYALVLGLDVLGNPYALISGIGEGVKDLFYEPYQGIIYGPQEFAEGLARGVKSLLGHVVGGTAGAFSRITGSIGQAVAALTFDTDYRLKRRQRMYVEPSGIGQGLLMGGKSLVMGLVFGIGGVVTKPIEGAKSEGVEGFFKGIGKGLLGLLMRPTGGVIDMVSFTLDGIRRSAEQGGEDIAYRMRLPRFAAPDEPLKPYSEEEAKGFGILKSLPRSLELSRDVYVTDYTISDQDNSGLVLLTNKRIIKLYQSRFWHEWKVDWICSYDEVSTAPFIASNSLVIKYQASGTSSDISTNIYEICSNNPEDLRALKSKISGLLRRYK